LLILSPALIEQLLGSLHAELAACAPYLLTAGLLRVLGRVLLEELGDGALVKCADLVGLLASDCSPIIRVLPLHILILSVKDATPDRCR